jgi:hypothetical protein
MIKSNLEPIEESDLDLESKIRGGSEKVSHENIGAPFSDVEREVPREISAAEKDDSYGKILSKVQTQGDDIQIDPVAVASDAKAGSEKMDAESQIVHLIEIAGQKGVVHAVKVAQHMQDNYILDTFHDRMLGDELHDALVAKGMIKEI